MTSDMKEAKGTPRRRLGKLVAWGLVAVVAVLGMAVGTVYALSERRITKTWHVDAIALEVRPSEDLVERGAAIATYRGCRDCHGENLAGRVFIDAMPVMRLESPNLTRNGIGARYSDDDWARAIRHGVRPDGTAILFMPAQEWTELSHEDMAALIAYVRSVPAVERRHEKSSVGLVGRLLFLAGELPLVPAEIVDHDASPAAITPGPTAEYGAYLISACTGCHGTHLSGGVIPGVPPEWSEAANLTSHESGLATWTESDFVRLLRSGHRPDGSEIAGEYMPWRLIGQSSDGDLRALWAYLQSLPPRPHGER